MKCKNRKCENKLSYNDPVLLTYGHMTNYCDSCAYELEKKWDAEKEEEKIREDKLER